MRGISFKVDSSENYVLASILEGIEIKKLFWSISEEEIYKIEGENLFEEKNIDGEKFLDKISENEYSVIFANIKAYPNTNTTDDINCYEDFLRSSCQLIILCSDIFYYEIYSKSKQMIEIIKSNCIRNAYHEIEYITDENDFRTIFSVI